jgi:uncharacterized membrane-anchored protein
VAVLVAAFAISTYEAWWTIALIVFGVIMLGIERSSLARREAIRTALGLIGSIILGAAGGWMLLLSQFRARPCDACFDNGVLLLPGIAALILAIAVGAICMRSIARGFAPVAGAESARDVPER